MPLPVQLHSGNVLIAYLVAFSDHFLVVAKNAAECPGTTHSRSHISSPAVLMQSMAEKSVTKVQVGAVWALWYHLNACILQIFLFSGCTGKFCIVNPKFQFFDGNVFSFRPLQRFRVTFSMFSIVATSLVCNIGFLVTS